MTSLSHRGYGILKSSLTVQDVTNIKNELTVTPSGLPCGMAQSHMIYKESSKKLYVPKCYGLRRFGVASINNIADGSDIDVEFNGSLRPEQSAPVEGYLTAAKDPLKMGGIISIVCGGGKTCIAIYIMCVLKKKTIIVVHKDFLLQQWKERIEQFAPTAKIGIFKGPKCDVVGKDVIIASIQSLSMKEYDPQLFADVGFIVFDEVHHTSAKVFSQALMKLNVRYSLGLSATPTRKDGLTNVFLWFLGDIVYNSTSRTDALDVHVKKFHDHDPVYSGEEYASNGLLNMSKMINKVCAFPARTSFIIQQLTTLLHNEPTRKIMVLSDRRTHLHLVADAMKQSTIKNVTHGFYYGGMKSDDLKKAEAAQIILSTFAYTSEGLDIRGLNTLVLASPKSDVVQVVGRILRDKPEDRIMIPLVVDIVDDFSVFARQAKKRQAYYKKCKYNILQTKSVPSANESKVECLIAD